MLVAKMRLLKRAKKKYGKIYPIRRKLFLCQCFTIMGKDLVLWFNTEDHSTHILKETIHN
jgi:hypothetical protein